MMFQDAADEEPLSEEEPEAWRPPVQCPECSGTETRFVSLRHEISVYECEVCGARFEVEE